MVKFTVVKFGIIIHRHNYCCYELLFFLYEMKLSVFSSGVIKKARVLRHSGFAHVLLQYTLHNCKQLLRCLS